MASGKKNPKETTLPAYRLILNAKEPIRSFLRWASRYLLRITTSLRLNRGSAGRTRDGIALQADQLRTLPTVGHQEYHHYDPVGYFVPVVPVVPVPLSLALWLLRGAFPNRCTPKLDSSELSGGGAIHENRFAGYVDLSRPSLGKRRLPPSISQSNGVP